MKNKACGWLLRVILVAAVIGAAPGSRRDVQAQATKQRGVSYVAWQPGEYSWPDSDQALANLRATGADWVSLIVTQYQDNAFSTEIGPTASTPTDADLMHAVARAHALGLKVMLKPHVDLSNDAAHWRGEIGQGFGEAQWAAWFTSYTRFITHYAQLAQACGVEQFCVGCELSATQGRVSQWRAAIAGVRSVYHGSLVYAANWGAEESLAWWDALDLIGVDAYYPLTAKNNPSLAELKAAWAPRVTLLRNLSNRWHKSVIFTEIGYRSQDGANQHPWDWAISGAIDLQEQADAYRAAFEVWFNQAWFGGMYWWVWGTNPAEGGPCNDDYTPHGKPAEDVLRAWYGAPPREIPREPLPDRARELVIYADGLGSWWEDWSWDGSISLACANPVYRGARSLQANLQAWGALSLQHASLDSSPYYYLEFFVRGSASGQNLQVYVNDENDQELRYMRLCVEPGVWTQALLPLRELNAASRRLRRVSIKNCSSQAALFWVDEMRLVGAVPYRTCLPLIVRGQ